VADLAARGLAFLHRARIRDGDRGEQRLRVVVLRIRVDLLGGPDLDQLAAVHHRDPVAQAADDCKIVRDEEVGEPEVVLQVFEQVPRSRASTATRRSSRSVIAKQLGL
jgi:hypothetical protein